MVGRRRSFHEIEGHPNGTLVVMRLLGRPGAWFGMLAEATVAQVRRLHGVPTIIPPAGALFQERAATAPGEAFNTVARRIATRMPAWSPASCRVGCPDAAIKATLLF